MRYISIFSGIEAASVALEGMGWEPVAFSEIDPFPSAVLQAHYPNVPNLGDITKIDWSPYRGSVDVVVGGSPCQSFSIAGGREGLDGESRLMYEYIRCIDEVRPRFLLWENVPGVFSVDGGRAFGILLDALENLGYSLAWRTLDAQFVRVADRDDSGRIRGWVGPVAQRRRRVFLVGHIGDGAAPAAVLFERESVSGNTQSSREKREELAASAGRRAAGGGFKWHQGAGAGSIGYEQEQSPSLTADYHNPACLTPWDAQSKRVFSDDGVSPSLQSGTGEGVNIQPSILTFAQNTRDEVRVQGDGTIVGSLSAQPVMKQTTYVCALQSDGSTSINSHGNGWQEDGSAYTLNLIDRQSVVCLQDGQANGGICDDHAPTLNAMHEQPIVIDRAAYNQGENAAYPPHIEQTEVMDPLVARGPHVVAHRTGTRS